MHSLRIELAKSDVSTTLGIYVHSMSKDRLAAQGDMLAAMMTPSNAVNWSDHRCEITPPDRSRIAGRSKFEQKHFRKLRATRRVFLRVPELRPTFSGTGGLESDQWKAPDPRSDSEVQSRQV
jgi:hypothetical protein